MISYFSSEESKKSYKEQTHVGMQVSGIVPHKQEPSERNIEHKMIEMLTDHIK